MATLLSGAATGADYQFHTNARERLHEVINYSFSGHRNKATNECIVELSDKDLNDNMVDFYLTRAAMILDRPSRFRNKFVERLIRRNFYQIKDTERVYAVSSFENDGYRVKGGTGWAVTMFIEKNKHKENIELYVYDQIERLWFELVNSGFNHSKLSYDFEFKPIDDPVPHPYGRYTGIGSRELNSYGIAAINGLYYDS